MSQNKDILNELYEKAFHEGPSEYFISPGRLEIIGNHTDHNGGLAIVAGASLRMYAASAPNGTNKVRLYSDGFGMFECQAKNLEPNPKEFGRTSALIQGVVSGFMKRGYSVGGINIAMYSEVLSGSGISSSAAFETLVCEVLNYTFNKGKVSKMDMVKISQEAESLYFGKPCGLLDQIGSCYGDISIVDFKDKTPVVESTKFPFKLHIFLVNPGGSHAGLTDYYASIPRDMKNVAKALGKEILREVDEEAFDAYLTSPSRSLTEMERNRAIHFFNENRRVREAFEAINHNDEEAFINIINESGLSSSFVLQNTFVPGRKEHSPEEALEIARDAAPLSAHRVHGGGFMGTTISFVKDEEVEAFKKAITDKYGENGLIEVEISRGAGLL
ncbi:MAG: hypothetical protein J5880_01440 [Bacilli bacterium]|nr:hypothetical protein [Bacilli bacterium]